VLPAYISYFVERNSKSQESMITSHSSRTSNLGLILVKRLIYSILVGLLVTAGFIAIFGLVGLGITAAGTGVVKIFSLDCYFKRCCYSRNWSYQDIWKDNSCKYTIT
jgi:cytochrome c biogenesis protein CcdA